MKSVLQKIVINAALLGVMAIAAPTVSVQADDLPLLANGTLAPDFTAQAWDGKAMHLSDYRGKIVVLDFWASWCPPCNASMPHLQNVHQLYKDDGVVVLGLCVWDTDIAANTWVVAHPGYTFSLAFDPAGRSPNALTTPYHVTGIPTTYIINKQGAIVNSFVVPSEQNLIDTLKSLGAQTPREKFQAKLETEKAASKIYAGEISLRGTVVGDANGKEDFMLSAIAVTSPSGDTHSFDKPRSKKILVDTNTVTIAPGADTPPSELKAGLEMTVIGLDMGPGKGLQARCIKVLR